MSARTTSALAWTLCVLALAATAAAPPTAAALGHLELLFVPSLVAAASFAVVGAMVAARRRSNPIGWLLCFVALSQALEQLAAIVATVPAFPGSKATLFVWEWLWAPHLAATLTFILLLFPDGHLPSPRWRPPAWAAGVLVVAGTAALATARSVWSTFLVVMSLFAILVLIALVSVAARYRAANAERREQLKWVTFGAGALVVAFLLNAFLWEAPGPWDAAVSLGVLAFPVSVAVAILRYRLYDIDVVISRSLVFAALAAFITGVYVAIVVGTGRAVSSAGRYDLVFSILATATVAVAFQPVRERLQRLANRLVYGRRATPYEVMADFSRRMARALTAEQILPRMAEAAGRGVGGEQAWVRVFLPGGATREVRWPARPTPPREPDQRVPVLHHEERVGEIAIAKPAGEPFSRTERRLLLDLAAQAGLVFDNLRLTLQIQDELAEISAQADALTASRRRIVAAANEQRRRLELELHEGTERELAVVAARLEEAARLLVSEPEPAIRLLDVLRGDANRTLEGLRELARGVFPPLLADRGLVAAVTSHMRKLDVPVDVKADAALESRRFDPQLEAAAYFCCVAALRGASGPAVVRLAASDGSLELAVAGPGIGDGIAVRDIEDRIAACDGSMELVDGTLTARIPLGTALAEPVG